MSLEPFAFGLDTAITFGAGRRREAGRVASTFGRRAALVTGQHSFAAGPHAAELEASLREAEVQVVARCQVTGEPEIGAVMAAADALREHGADVVLAIGGGSVLDLAKAAAISAGSVIDAEQLATGPRFDRPVGVPVVALPTTAGSGAEVSRGAIVMDPDTGRKHGIRDGAWHRERRSLTRSWSSAARRGSRRVPASTRWRMRSRPRSPAPPARPPACSRWTRCRD